jgi:hypothetical protein
MPFAPCVPEIISGTQGVSNLDPAMEFVRTDKTDGTAAGWVVRASLAPDADPSATSPAQNPEPAGSGEPAANRTPGGGSPPIEPPRGPEGVFPGPDDDGFISPRPATIEAIKTFQQTLTEELIRAPLSADEIADRLRSNPAIVGAYPEAAVSPEFKAAHPNIRFTPPWISEGRLRAAAGSPMEQALTEQVIAYAKSNGLDQADITTPEDAARWMTKLGDELSGNVPEHILGTLLKDTLRAYTSNLELGRLTRHPNGLLVRYTNTPDMDRPQPAGAKLDILARIDNYLDIASSPIHPALHNAASESWGTTWYRQEPDPSELDRRGFSERIASIETTVRKLERSGAVIALDRSTSAGMSLLALRPLPE